MLGLNKISSLEEKASTQVAINLCQENGFKEVALCFEKPTYGGFIGFDAQPFFVSNPETLSKWAKVKEEDRLCDVFMRSCYLDDTEKIRQWDTAIDEQCQRLTEGIPNKLRQKIHPWMNRVALEYLSYSRRQEVLFGVSRYFLMNIVTRGDWKEAARLDEKKLAQRLLEDERLTVLQRYRIACVYCLHVHIPQLWERLTQEEKRFTSGNGKLGLSEESHRLVLLWSRYMNANPQKKVTRRAHYLWTAVSQTVSYGNCTALMVCWKELQEDIRQEMVIYLALESLQKWQRLREFHVKNKLVSHQLPEKQSAHTIKHFNLPSYYSKLMLFFLSQVDEEQQLTFFKKAFQRKSRKSVLECFLEWPHQDNFLLTINRLWGIISKYQYGKCLLALAKNYSGIYKRGSRDNDYRSVLSALWEETPEEYKQYVFGDRNTDLGSELLVYLSARSPFQEKEEVVFKRIFRDQPQERRRSMMHSIEGTAIYSYLIQKEKLSFLNGFLEECLPKEEIPDFKKRFIQSYFGVKLCSGAFKDNREKLVENLFHWSFESEAEKMRYKEELIENNDCLNVCVSFLREGKFADVERVINFCLSSDEKKGRFKVRFAQSACSDLLYGYICDSSSEDCVWKQMDTIIAWSIDTEERIRDFKKDLLSRERIYIHDELVFVTGVWGKVERFYQWFDLSPEEIKQLKRDTIFRPRRIQLIAENLCDHTEFVAPLHWCLTDEEMVIDLKKEVEVYCTDVSDERWEMKKERLDYLVSEFLDGFRKEVQDKTSREGVGEKRSVGIEDESSSTRKRHK